ncbi:MAG: LysR family transcriptional regulator [Pseudomonadota bacterium]
MIDYLRHMAIFSSVAEKGSFSEAAKSLGIAPSRVSEAISKLEHYVDATLFQRTTRKVTLTSEGRRLYTYTASIVGDAHQGIDALKDAKSSPSGTLNISVPSYLTNSPVLAAVGAFGEAYPDVQIAISFTDNQVDPIKDGFDVCVRAGKHEGPSVAVQKLGELERVIVVGRDYFAKHEVPEHPKDLESWNWITYRYKKRSYKLSSKGGKRARLLIEDQSKFQVDSFDGLQFLTRLNLGVSVMPIEICRDGIEQGDIVQLFDDWRLSKVQLFAVTPEKTKPGSLISFFVQFLTDRSASA